MSKNVQKPTKTTAKTTENVPKQSKKEPTLITHGALTHMGACFFKGWGVALNPAQTLFFARAFFSIYGTLGNSTPLNNISQNAECANMLMC